MHVPFFDHVFTPGEFVDTKADNLLTWPAFKEVTFHVTAFDGDAAFTPTPPPTETPAKMPTRSNTPADRRE